MRPWVIQAHYDHAGWYIAWRYLVDDTLSITGNPVVVWRVDVVFLEQGDWKYERSKAGPTGGGRTHTFGLKSPAKRLAGAAVFRRADVELVAGKPVPVD